MTVKTSLNVPINRVEGDLELRVRLEDGRVTEAWSSGTMYRGFERILVGRGAMDGLVITPRVCGICGTAHLTAAARALEMIAGVKPPPDATRLRNVCLMVEHVQSDMRHAFLTFAVDFVNRRYSATPLFDEALRRYEPFKGETVIEVVRETKKALEIIAILGGQWPHSSFIIPGGIASLPSGADLRQCLMLLRHYRRWYERRILGCAIERWSRVRSAADLAAWMEEDPAHRDGDLGFYLRYGRSIGLEQLGRGHGNFLSYGYLDLPEGTKVKPIGDDGFFVPAGFVRGDEAKDFDQNLIAEHVAHSWYANYEGGKHPFDGETKPYATGLEGKKYSWAKAPRYDGQPAETGPLAEMAVAGKPLFVDLLKNGGPNAFVRQLARLVRPAELLPAMEQWLTEVEGDGDFYHAPGDIVDGEGYGLTHAARGALGHWVRVAKGKITHYQMITPTSWHASPRDANDVRGPTEEALIGAPVDDQADPLALGHIVRSFDHCLVCTVHALQGGAGVRI
jgi:hydrogenase large subunit